MMQWDLVTKFLISAISSQDILLKLQMSFQKHDFRSSVKESEKYARRSEASLQKLAFHSVNWFTHSVIEEIRPRECDRGFQLSAKYFLDIDGKINANFKSSDHVSTLQTTHHFHEFTTLSSPYNLEVGVEMVLLMAEEEMKLELGEGSHWCHKKGCGTKARKGVL